MAARSQDHAAFYFTSSVTPTRFIGCLCSIYARGMPFGKTNHALSDVVPADCLVSPVAGLYGKEYGNGNPALLFRVRMAGTINIDCPAVVRLGSRNRSNVVPRQDISPKAGNCNGQKKVPLAGGTWIDTGLISR